jgi:hypothetical protein
MAAVAGDATATARLEAAARVNSFFMASFSDTRHGFAQKQPLSERTTLALTITFHAAEKS